MSNHVVVPFPAARSSRSANQATRVTWPFATSSQAVRLVATLSTVRGVVRAVVETFSYLGEARVRPPVRPALPPRSPRK